jgi:hypothetical protein
MLLTNINGGQAARLDFEADKTTPKNTLAPVVFDTAQSFESISPASGDQVYFTRDDHNLYKVSSSGGFFYAETVFLDSIGNVDPTKKIKLSKTEIKAGQKAPINFLMIDNNIYGFSEKPSEKLLNGFVVSVGKETGANTNTYGYVADSEATGGNCFLVLGDYLITNIEEAKGYKITGHFNYRGDVCDLITRATLTLKDEAGVLINYADLVDKRIYVR